MSESRHPGTTQLLGFFSYEHLPADLQEISRACSELAEAVLVLPDSSEFTAGLRKLLEAKDCFVRAALLARKEA